MRPDATSMPCQGQLSCLRILPSPDALEILRTEKDNYLIVSDRAMSYRMRRCTRRSVHVCTSGRLAVSGWSNGAGLPEGASSPGSRVLRVFRETRPHSPSISLSLPVSPSISLHISMSPSFSRRTGRPRARLEGGNGPPLEGALDPRGHVLRGRQIYIYICIYVCIYIYIYTYVHT